MRRLRPGNLRGGASVIAVLAIVAGIFVAGTSSAQAVNAADFSAGNIISNTVFYAGTATKASSIQGLLDTLGSGCTANGTLKCLKDVTVTVPASAGDQYCAAIRKATGQTAAQIFASVGAACSINPSVLVVLVQKEQSLVTRSSPSTSAYEHATGYNCSDSAPCSASTAGFYTQVFHAAKQFQRYRQHPSSYSFQAGHYNTISYHPATSPSCGGSSVFIENSATAGLYDYTPYQPNRAALANLTGTGDRCSSYGNRNFWTYYNSWFGNTGNLLKASSFEGSTSGWSFGSHISHTLEGTAAGAVSAAQAGRYYESTHTTKADSTISQTVKKKLKAGHTYSGSIWLRATSTTTPFTGKLVVWGLGGTTESAVTPFSVGTTWTQFSADLTPKHSSHTSIKLQLYESTIGDTLQVDAANLSPQAPLPQAGPVTIASPSFESGAGAWTVAKGMTKTVVESATEAEDGTHYLAITSPKAAQPATLSVARIPHSGETYTATVWMRSGSPTGTVTGRLALWALGGTSETAVTAYSVGQTWTPVVVNLPVIDGSHSHLRLNVYPSTVSTPVDLDNVSLVANLISNGSFETGVTNLSQSNGTATITSVPSDPSVPGLIAGAHAAEFTVASTGSSVATGVPRTLVAGETYTASIWVRTADPTQVFNGKLALWATGGTTQGSTTTITNLTGTWTKVQASLTLADASNNRLKLQVYSSSPGVEVVMDALVLQ